MCVFFISVSAFVQVLWYLWQYAMLVGSPLHRECRKLGWHTSNEWQFRNRQWKAQDIPSEEICSLCHLSKAKGTVPAEEMTPSISSLTGKNQTKERVPRENVAFERGVEELPFTRRRGHPCGGSTALWCWLQRTETQGIASYHFSVSQQSRGLLGKIMTFPQPT